SPLFLALHLTHAPTTEIYTLSLHDALPIFLPPLLSESFAVCFAPRPNRVVALDQVFQRRIAHRPLRQLQPATTYAYGAFAADEFEDGSASASIRKVGLQSQREARMRVRLRILVQGENDVRHVAPVMPVA